MQGARGQIRSGGDAAGAELSGSPPTQALLALYSGIVTIGRDGTAQVGFDIPAFAGTVRVMAVAWSKDKVGKAAGDVAVRDPVVLTATLPRFLRALGCGSDIEVQRGRISLPVAAAGAGPGTVSVKVTGGAAGDADSHSAQRSGAGQGRDAHVL